MPFTPYHFGPGMMIKALLRRWFSLSIFIFTQILTDFETLYFILKRELPLHRLLHTYLGATITVFVGAVLGRPLYHAGLRLWGRTFKGAIECDRMTWSTAFVSAAIGAYSHVFLDSIMHSDARPFKPFSMANPVLGLMPLDQLLVFCVLSGLCGGAFLYIAKRTKP